MIARKQLYVICLNRAFVIGYKRKPFIYARESANCARNWGKKP